MSEPFGLRIEVQDGSGRPVPDLRVSIINEILWTLGGPVAQEEPSRVSVATAAVTISFIIEESSDVTLEVFDQLNDPVATLIDERRNSGLYNAGWSDTALFPSGFYSFVLTARDTVSGDTLFSDWKRSALIHQDPATSALGYTDVNGVFELDEVLRFPHLVGPTDQLGTNAIGAGIGNFVFSDTATVVLTDTTTSDTTMHRIEVHPGANSVVLTWAPTPSPVSAALPEGSAPVARAERPQVDAALPFRLYTPYPNPYE